MSGAAVPDGSPFPVCCVGCWGGKELLAQAAIFRATCMRTFLCTSLTSVLYCHFQVFSGMRILILANRKLFSMRRQGKVTSVSGIFQALLLKSIGTKNHSSESHGIMFVSSNTMFARERSTIECNGKLHVEC